MQNLKILNYYRFRQKKIMHYISQMFWRASRNNICINELDIYVNTHLICIRYANIYHIKKIVLYLPIKQCFTLYTFYAEQLKTY